MGKFKTWYKKMLEKRKERIRNLKGIQGFSTTRNYSARWGCYFCPDCNDMLSVEEKEKVVNSDILIVMFSKLWYTVIQDWSVRNGAIY